MKTRIYAAPAVKGLIIIFRLDKYNTQTLALPGELQNQVNLDQYVFEFDRRLNVV